MNTRFCELGALGLYQFKASVIGPRPHSYYYIKAIVNPQRDLGSTATIPMNISYYNIDTGTW